MIGQRIKELREEYSMSQQVLGKRLNLSQQTVDHYEKDRAKPSLETLKLLSQIFRVPTDYLLGLDDSRPERHLNYDLDDVYIDDDIDLNKLRLDARDEIEDKLSKKEDEKVRRIVRDELLKLRRKKRRELKS